MLYYSANSELRSTLVVITIVRGAAQEARQDERGDADVLRSRQAPPAGAPPRTDKYTAWSYMDFNGHRWLVDESMERPKD